MACPAVATASEAKEKAACVIGLALLSLLLLASPSSGMTPHLQPQQRSDAQATTQQSNAVSSPTVTLNVDPSPAVTTEHGRTYTYNYYYQSNDGWNWSGWAQALFTLGLVIFAAWQMRFIRQSTSATQQAANAARDNAIASKDAANAAKAMADIASKQLEMSHRPRIKFDLKVAGDLLINPNGSITFEYEATIMNTGNSPALQVHIEKEVYVPKDGRGSPVAEQQTVSKRAALNDDPFSATVEAGDGVREKGKMTTAADEIRNAFSDPLSDTFQIFVVGCVDYKFSFAEGHHQTPFIYFLSRKGIGGFDPAISTVRAENLLLRRIVEYEPAPT
jgi:hypothetical protein